MASGMSHVDYAAQAVLASSELLLASPSNAKLTTFYPVPSECTSVIAQSICNTGQLFVAGNSQGLGTSTNFQISSANIIDTPMLVVELEVLGPGGASNKYAFVEDGWLYGLVKSYEVTYSNSNISNLVTRGSALRDWNLAQQPNHERRQQILRNGGRGEYFPLAADQRKTFKACIPLSFLNWGSGCVSNPGFPFDARTINGIIQVQINWADNINQVVTRCRVGNSANGAICDPLVSADIKKAIITMRSYQLLDSSFSVGNALAMDPSKRYVLPAKWLNSYTYEVGLTAVDDGALVGDAPRHLSGTIELNSAPAGMLQGIILHVKPTVVKNGAGGVVVPGAAWNSAEGQRRLGSARLNALSLTYSGQNIIRLTNETELDTFMKFIYGDDMKTKITSLYPSAQPTDGSNPSNFHAYTANDDAATAWAPAAVTSQDNPNPEVEIESQTYIIPFMHDGGKVFRERHFQKS